MRLRRPRLVRVFRWILFSILIIAFSLYISSSRFGVATMIRNQAARRIGRHNQRRMV
jgi:hypothetical protein